MSELKIVIAQDQRGLYAAAGTFTIIEHSKRKFEFCQSAYDHYFLGKIATIGAIDIGETGWVALAENIDV